MDKDREFLIKFLKENLSLECTEEGGVYGSQKYLHIQLKVDNEEIDSIYIDI